MVELIKTLFSTIESIRHPLAFWSFCAAIVLCIFLVLVKNPRWLELLLSSTGNKLTKMQFFQLLKTILIFLFILSLLTILLSFVAPVILNSIETFSGNLAKTVKESEGNILDSIDLDRKLARALQHFEDQEYEAAEILLTEVLTQTKKRPPSNIQGYIVNAYYKAGNYPLAAREVLERDKGIPPHSYVLWKDLAICIRKYALENSLPAAIKLTEELRDEYGDKLISNVWCVLPIDITMNLANGFHSGHRLDDVTDENRRDINFIIRTYGNDPYIEFAMYVMMQYQKALSINPHSLIRDILLYAAGYQILLELRSELYNQQDVTSLYRKAKKFFQAYVTNFPSSKHADDSCAWIGWLEWHYGDFDEALKWFRSTEKYGNGDFIGFAHDWETRALSELPAQELVRRLQTDDKIRRPAKLWTFLVKKEYNSKNYENAEILSTMGITYCEKLKSKGFDIYDYDMDDLHYFEEAVKLVRSAQKSSDPKEYKRIGNIFRTEYHNYEAAIYLYDEALRKSPGSDLADNFMFLKVLAYRSSQPNKVKEIVEEYYQSFPQSEFIDDALAELAFTELRLLGDSKTGTKTVRRVLKEYPDRNACDNALNWLAYTAMRDREYDNARELYKEILQRFPKTRFAKYAENNLQYLNDNKR
jgi:outer membrane protein assembly factor BamD (BamD/ComL family)